MKDVNILTSNGVNVQQSLELFGDMEMYDETLNDFLEMVEGKLQSLENRKSASDMVNYAIEVHALKSDARYLGFTTLADLSYESEMKSKAGDIMFVQENHPKIIAEARRMIEVAKQYLGVGGATTAPVAQQVVQPVQPVQPVQQPQMAQPQAVPMQPQAVPPVQAAPAVQQPQVQYQQPVDQMQQQTSGQVQFFPQDPMAQAITTQMPAQPQVAQPQYQQPVDQMQQQSSGQVQFFPADNAANNTSSQVQFFPTDNSVNSQVQFFPQDPMAQAISTQMPVQTQSAPGQVPAANGTKEGIILIVDDSNLVANFVKKIFDARYNVLIAEDGAKAIELVDQDDIRKDIKACLLDLNMPNVDGYQVLEHFKQKGYFVRMPVAVESGVEDMASLDKVNTYPIVDILSKPFNERDVQRVIEKCLATYF